MRPNRWLAERVKRIEGHLNTLTDDILGDLEVLDEKTDTVLQVYELTNPDALAEAREAVKDEQ